MGKIILILGPMYAGKTTELLRRIVRSRYAGCKTIILKPDVDTRYEKASIVTHSGITMKCKSYDTITDEELNAVDVIGIDEGQFATNIRDFITKWSHKHIIISGLNGTYERNIFPEIASIIGYACDIIYLTAVCTCGADATYTKKIHIHSDINDTSVNIGGMADYIAVCDKCFHL